MEKHFTSEEIEVPAKWDGHVARFVLRFGGLRPPDPEDPFLAEHKKRGSDFAYVSDRFYVDVNGRHEPKNFYRAVHVGEAKVVRARHLSAQGIQVFFVIAFTDALCLWRFDGEQYEVRYNPTYTAGSEPKIKSYVQVPIHYLEDIITDADLESEKSDEPGIHHEEAVQQAPFQDAGRDHSGQQTEGEEAGGAQAQVSASQAELKSVL